MSEPMYETGTPILMGQTTPVSDLADMLTPSDEPAKVRIGVITAIQNATGSKVRTDQTADAWLNRSEDATLQVGDRVWMVQMGEVFIVAGRLSGDVGGPPVGSVNAFAGGSAPSGWLTCNGAAVSRETYAALFAVIGTAYGSGDGSTTFNVPNFSNRLPMGSGDTFPRGSIGGAQSVTLTEAQMPSHNHGSSGSHTHASDGGHSHSIPNAAGSTGTAIASEKTVANATGGSTGGVGDHNHGSAGSHSHGDAGGDQAFSIVPPYTAIPYIIKAY